MRGSDPDAAIYWLARMLEAGEDPRFIARRIVICASEDVGNADPQALVVAAAALQATEFVGLPECQLALAQAVTYIATAPKSNAATLAIGKARDDVRNGRTLPVPEHLRDTHYQGRQAIRPRRGLQVQPRLRRRLGGPGVFAGGPTILSTGGSWLRGGDQEADGRAAGEEIRRVNQRKMICAKVYVTPRTNSEKTKHLPRESTCE